MSREEIKKTGTFYTVIEGTFRTRVDETDEDAERREWSTPDGKTGVKWERVIGALVGKIEGIAFYESDYGKNLQITLAKDDPTDKTRIISLGTASNYGEDTMKKLPNVNLTKEIRFRPFCFTAEDTGKEVRGMELTQQDEQGKFTKKVTNYFWNVEKKEARHGYPTPEGDVQAYSSDDWKIFYLQARKFLIQNTIEQVISKVSTTGNTEPPADYPVDEDALHPAF